MRARVDQIDIAKGIGILLVVLGHNRALTNALPAVHSVLYLFHMPLFFLLSGLTTPTTLNQEKLFKRIKGLLKPYVAGVLFLLPLQLKNTHHPSNEHFFLNIAWGSGNAIYNTPIWFLTALLVGYLLFALIQHVRSKLQTAASFPLVAIFSISLTYWLLATQLGFELLPHNAEDHPLGAPLNLDLAPLVASFLLLGTWWQHQAKTYSSQTWITILAVSSLAFGIGLAQEPELDLNFRLAHAWPAALLCGFAGITSVMSASHLIDRHAVSLRKLLLFLGQNTLIILIFHAEVQRQINRVMSHDAPLHPAISMTVSLLVCIGLAILSSKLINRTPTLRRIFYVQ